MFCSISKLTSCHRSIKRILIDPSSLLRHLKRAPPTRQLMLERQNEIAGRIKEKAADSESHDVNNITRNLSLPNPIYARIGLSFAANFISIVDY